jgi:hypothetical protein
VQRVIGVFLAGDRLLRKGVTVTEVEKAFEDTPAMPKASRAAGGAADRPDHATGAGQ